MNFWGGESLLLWQKEKREKSWGKKGFDTYNVSFQKNKIHHFHEIKKKKI